MKPLTNLLVAASVVCVSAFTSFAQDQEPKTQMFMIHVDRVIASKAMQYEEANKGFTALCTENKLTCKIQARNSRF